MMTMTRNICIICRTKGKEMSDEHIIPEALGGKIHSFCVCKECNSKLGSNVDNHLIDHWFAQAFRHQFKLKGYSGKIPNPLLGDGTLADGTRVKTIADTSGVIAVKHIPTKPEVSDDGMSFSFSVDAADAKEIDKIKAKMIKRLGIDLSKYQVKEEVKHMVIEKPEVKSSFKIDILNYKIGLLKIAYEFACERIPEYFESKDAETISTILHDADIAKMKGLCLVSDSFPGVDNHFFEDYIDYGKENRHVLILLNVDGKLYCLVRIGNYFESVVLLANSEFPIAEEAIICINDLDKSTPQSFTLTDLINNAVRSSSLSFKFDDKIAPEVESLLKCGRIGISCNRYNDNIIYNAYGHPVISTQDFLFQSSAIGAYQSSRDDKGNLITTYPLSGSLFYKGMPGDYLIPIAEIIELQEIEKI